MTGAPFVLDPGRGCLIVFELFRFAGVKLGFGGRQIRMGGWCLIEPSAAGAFQSKGRWA